MSFDLGPQGSLHQTVQAVVTVLAVINPVVCGSIFVTLTRSMDSGTQRRAAVRVTLVILAILVASALVGLAVLSAFGISLDVFRIVGGMIVAYMGFGMLSGRNQVGQAPPSESDADASDAGGSLAPLIMFAAGPGTITAVVTLAAVHTPRGVPLTALTAAVVGTAATFGMLLLAIRAGSRLDRSTQAFVTRFMGLIVASMGMQFVLAGLKAFLAT